MKFYDSPLFSCLLIGEQSRLTATPFLFADTNDSATFLLLAARGEPKQLETGFTLSGSKAAVHLGCPVLRSCAICQFETRFIC